MCNLYTTRASAAEVAALFRARLPADTNAGPGAVYPGYTGMVVRQDAGERVVEGMTWGFPFKPKDAKPESRPRPVNNARADKLDGYMWKYSFLERRCLIPVTAFAEAEGEKGAKTRTWFSLPDEPLFAVAGLWRDTTEWGRAYTMVMTEACLHVADVHDRMPVILRRSDWDDWLDGAPDAAGLLCRPYPDLMVVDRTAERWNAR